MNIPEGYLTTKQALKYIPVHVDTLRKWGDEGKIDIFRAPSGQARRFYNVKKFIEKDQNPNCPEEEEKPRRKYCYCRVSTAIQKDDLERQVSYMRERYPDYTIIKDVGSGLNFKRKGLQRLINEAIQGEIEEIVVTYKDRLCRFGFELIDNIVRAHSKGEIVVLHQPCYSPQEELVTDLLSIITVFSARLNGLRRYHTQISEDKNLTNRETKENI